MKSLKKIELHLHLEGAAPPDFVRGLADQRGLAIPDIFDENGNYAWRDFSHFLKVYEAATDLIRTPEDYAKLVSTVLEQEAEHGAIYVELFVSPEFCGGGDVSAWREYLAAMTEAAASLRAQGVDSRGIVTPIRHFGAERSRKTAICAAETTGDWITGFGLAGAEGIGAATDFAWAFDCAREAGLGLTCHAGEWAGPASVREALELGVTRIGHGVRAIEDPLLVSELAERGITLEVCPGSNVSLGLYPTFSAHPIAELADAGCRVTISTDDPPFFHTDLTHEYDRLSDAFGWADPDFKQMNNWAAEAAFCDDTTRKNLIAALD
ncbi:MAG: adenosine deaminase [Paracoccus denitrificans]|nr:MAG: adenosine deaminase [Paracoccus denitrificans]PZO84391.1 MAG: adenosine deaminase [Paracoccus denitrificans]